MWHYYKAGKDWNFSTPVVREAKYAYTEMEISETTPSEEPTASGREGIHVRANESQIRQEKWYYVAPPSDVSSRKITEGVYVRGSSDSPNIFPAVVFYEDTEDRVDGGLVSNRVNLSRYGKTGFVTTDEYGNQKASLNNLGVFSAYEVDADYGTIGSLTSNDYFATDNLGHNSHLTPSGLTVDSHDLLRLSPHFAQMFATAIPANADLNSVTYCAVGQYYCPYDATAASLSNCPTSYGFYMIVEAPLSTSYDNESSGTYVYRMRRIIRFDGVQYFQRVNSGATAGTFTYGEWFKILDSRVAEDNSVYWLKGQAQRPSSLDFTHIYNDSRVHARLDISSTSVANNPFGEGYLLTFMWDNSGVWDTQFFLPIGSSTMKFRRKRNNANWDEPSQIVAKTSGTTTVDGITWTWDKYEDGYVDMYADITLNGTWVAWGNQYILRNSTTTYKLPFTMSKKLVDVTSVVGQDTSSNACYPVNYSMISSSGVSESYTTCDIGRPSAGANNVNYYCRKYVRGIRQYL